MTLIKTKLIPGAEGGTMESSLYLLEMLCSDVAG